MWDLESRLWLRGPDLSASSLRTVTCTLSIMPRRTRTPPPPKPCAGPESVPSYRPFLRETAWVWPWLLSPASLLKGPGGNCVAQPCLSLLGPQLTHLLLLHHTADLNRSSPAPGDSCLTSSTLLSCSLFQGYSEDHMPGPAPEERTRSPNGNDNSKSYTLLLGRPFPPSLLMSVFPVCPLLFPKLPVSGVSVWGHEQGDSPHLPSCSIWPVPHVPGPSSVLAGRWATSYSVPETWI